MTNDQKEKIVAILEAAKNADPRRTKEIDALIFAVRASSPYPKPTERLVIEWAGMKTVEDQRLRFIKSLASMDEAGRAHLLRIETDDELGELFNLAMKVGDTGVAASIEVAAAQ